MSLSHWFAYLHMYALPTRCSCTRTGLPTPHHLLCPFHSPVLFTSHATGVMWPFCCFENDRANYSLSRQTLLSVDLQCCESWRDAVLGDYAMCPVTELSRLAVRVGASHRVLWLIKHGSRSAELFYVFSRLHHDSAVGCLTNDTLIKSVRVDTPTDARDHWPFATRPTTPAVHVVAVVYYAIPMTRLLLSTCCLPMATYFGGYSRAWTDCVQILQNGIPCLHERGGIVKTH